MKKSIKLFGLLLLAGAIFMSCEGPKGPAGTDGIDGSTTCFACHDGVTIETVQGQFYASQHALGDIAVDYAGGRSYCAECHSHQGFVEYQTTGSIAANYSAPEAWKCATCHTLHVNLDSTDWALRGNDAITLKADGTTVLDEGNNNVCLNCHQSRRNDSYYDKYTTATTVELELAEGDTDDYDFYAAEILAGNINFGTTGSVKTDNGSDTLIVEFDVATTHVLISSSHAGPHHGPQGNVWAGVGAAGSVTGSAFSGHSGGCTACHMGDAMNHSFKPDDDNCTDCHTSKDTEMDAIAARVEAVGAALEAIHAVHKDSEGVYHPVQNIITRAQFQAFWNFMIVLEDRSDGAHNPTYAKAMLTQCESALGI